MTPPGALAIMQELLNELHLKSVNQISKAYSNTECDALEIACNKLSELGYDVRIQPLHLSGFVDVEISRRPVRVFKDHICCQCASR